MTTQTWLDALIGSPGAPGGDTPITAAEVVWQPASDTSFKATSTLLKATTTNATPSTALTVTCATNHAYRVIVSVLARSSGGAVWSRDLVATYKRASGDAIIVGELWSANEATEVASLTWGATIVGSGATVLVQVTGQAATTIKWRVSVTVEEVD